VVKPVMDNSPHVEFIGEINDGQKSEFLGKAKGLLFPICWPEPFGLVMIESMACGTPVIAFNCGSVPEIMENGLTGFVVDNVDQAVEACGKLDTLFRPSIRSRFEERFSVSAMARDYVEIYRKLAASDGVIAVAAE
jgi:glycosyltransferase involved in cell wall biosynthesis